MLQLTATLHVLGLRLADRTRNVMHPESGRERGNITTEQVIWIAAIIAIATAVILIVRAYIDSQTAQIV